MPDHMRRLKIYRIKEFTGKKRLYSFGTAKA